MSDDLIAVVIVLAIMLLVAFPIHEYSHALAAWRLGDGTARLYGRLTLNPLAHFDPMGGSILAITMVLSVVQGTVAFGWAKPTPVNTLNLRGGRESAALVAAAGPLSNLVLAAVGGLTYRIMTSVGLGVPPVFDLVLQYFVFINVALMIFNFLPIAPLDGFQVLFALLPASVALRWGPIIQQYGFVVLLIAILLPIFPGGLTLIDLVFQVIAFPLIRLLMGW